MKINVHTKFTKKKIVESKSKFKTKLTSRKAHKKKMRAARKNTRENTTVNLANDTCTNDGQNISLAGERASLRERTTAQGSVKRKKEPSDGEETVNETSPSVCYLRQNDFIEWEKETNKETDDDWKLDNSKDETQEDDDWTHIAPKEKRNLGSPVVVDTTRLSHSVTSTSLPKIFEREQMIRSEERCDDAFELDALFIKQVCMTNGQLNYKHSRAQRKHLKEASPVPSSEDDRSKDASDDKLEDPSNISSPIKSPMRKKIVKNRNPESVNRSNKIIEDESSSSVDRSNNVETSSSSRRKNVSSRQRKRNQKQPAVYAIENIVIVIMESGSKLCFTGKLLVKVLYGAIKVYGSILNKSSGTTEVYSPRGYSNVVIETNEEFPKDNIDDVWTALAAWGIPDQLTSEKTKLTENMANVQPGTAVFVLQNFENNLTFFLKTYFPYIRLFPNVKNPCHFSWTDPRRAEVILQANLYLEQYDFNHRRLIIDPHIMDIAKRMLNSWRANEWSCTLIAGGKSVGKSTSIRCLINSLLRTSEKVVLIDVDPGQAECTPYGCISYSLIEEPLLGPNFTHLKTPVYQLFIDDVNVSRCVTRYLEGIKMLIEKLKGCPVLSRLPIVVNTMGFTQNLGWDIAIFTIKLVRPSIILQIMSSKKKNNYNNFLSAEVVNKQECTWTFCDERFIDWTRPCQHDLCVINSHAETVSRTNEWNMEPYQQRELVMMSYLSDIVCDKNDPLQYYTGLSVSINEAVPYTAPFSSLCIIPQRLFGVPASRALSVINGNIVALCGIDLTEESSQKSTDISSLRVLTQRSPLCTCYGFGIIRGVDMDQQKVFINTPLSISMMQYINCLAGCIPVPPALLQLHQGAPYVGGKAALPTSREPRKGYFRMKYSNKPSKS